MTQEENNPLIPKLRFPEFRNAGGWRTVQLSEVLDYERPDRYIVNDTNYVNDGIPVLTANKSFVIGYTRETENVYTDVPVVIFDDFTTDKKLVTFAFKVKSSAIKILKAKKGDDLRLLYELMAQIKFDAQEHKRYYISEYQYIKIPLPEINEQKKIAECLSTLDELIEAESRKLNALKDHKKGLMQQLFPREGETRPRLRFPEFRSSPDWTTRRMNEIYAFLANNSFSRDRLNYVSGSIKNIHYGDIHKHYRLLFDVTREVVPYINDDALTSESQPVFCAEGDMVFADASEDLEDIGKCIEIVNLNNERVVAGLHTILARPKTRSAFARGFSGYLFSSKRIRAQIQKESQGTKVLGISAKRLANIELCFPVHVAEQERIADCLSSLDDLIAAQSERLEALRAHKRGLMQQLFPNPSEFES